MAAEQQLKDKKKNRFRERFLLTQAASLDEVVTPSAERLKKCDRTSGSTEGDDPSRTAASTSLSNCSRMRRMLFRRTRSETEGGARSPRVSKADSIANSTPEQGHPRLNFTPQSAVLEEGSTASTAVTRLQSLMPRSPPPPYDGNSESESVRSGSICPPTYDEAMAQNGPNDQNDSNLSTMVTAMPIGYCNCRECQFFSFDSSC
ncbi:hypothetical protein DAPPUDRAFT_242330 [Daphnia pulex]|uniref:Uncharacterized protein n=1 Tax=Daphnia pulex TaxID=6669 RepID=E9GGE2_DAPPU|nr:hypothetical protein DAPPUDRAFT_242330 [Daphnia pulex]|eukprot:EFX81389.1 hypothetical protein DAPPUDRAFT_242330 [Daphnia pulex]